MANLRLRRFTRAKCRVCATTASTPAGFAYSGEPPLNGAAKSWNSTIRIFEARPWVPDSGWPFAKAELTPFYRRALEIEGLSKAIADDRAVWKMLNIAAPDLGRH